MKNPNTFKSKFIAALGVIASIIAILTFLNDDTSERLERLEDLQRTNADGSFKFSYREQAMIDNARRQLWGR